MEFWGVEVPAGKPTSCSPGYGMYLHVSQAALGESKDKSGKGNARVVLKVDVNDSEVLLGTLSEGKCDQMPLDLVFDREFTVSHNSTSASVYLCGYRTEGPEEDDSEDDEEEEDEEEEEEAPVPVAVPITTNGAVAGKQIKAGKTEKVEKVSGAEKIPVKATGKAQPTANVVAKAEKKSVKKQVVESSSDEEDESEEEDEGMGHPFVSDLASESDDEFDAGDDSDEDMDEDDDDDEDGEDEDESDESEEEELKIEAPKAGKKRAAAELTKSAEKKSKTDAAPKPGQSPGSGKKAKAGPVTPVGKAAAPAEVKTPTDKGSKPAKTPKGTPTAPPTTPVSEKKIGQHKCSGCDRTFTTESAMSQHAAAKHK